MKTASFVLGSLAGAVVGALFAPRSGRATRRLVRTWLSRSEYEPPHADSPTAVVAEMLRTGVVELPPSRQREPRIPGEDAVLTFDDPDVDPLRAAYVGDEVPGGDMTTPDESQVDGIGRAYGVAEEDSGALVTTAEVLTRRDQRKRRK
jgi:hypothetical protein